MMANFTFRSHLIDDGRGQLTAHKDRDPQQLARRALDAGGSARAKGRPDIQERP